MTYGNDAFGSTSFAMTMTCKRMLITFTIRDDHDMQTYVDYIHFNPVKHGYVKRPVDWQWSSIHRYIREGLIDKNWAVDADNGSKFGE
jgi:hypothetical protein